MQRIAQRAPRSLLAWLLLATAAPMAAGQQMFLRGDANSDGVVSVSDEITIQRHLFLGGVLTGCNDAADTNDDGQVNISDQVEILKLLADPAYEGWTTSLPSPYPESGLDPTSDDVTCQEYDVTPALESADDALVFERVFATPGETVEVPILVTNTVPLDAVQIVLEYDPALVTPVEGRRPSDELGSAYDHLREERHFQPVFLVNAYPDRGYVVVVVVGSLSHVGLELPPGERNHLASIFVRVAADAPPDCTISLTPVDGAVEGGVGPHRMRTEMTFSGGARYLSLLPRTAPASICLINPDFQDFFIRGDANDDGAIDVSDPLATLGYLFRRDAAPPCADAADANDDGALNIVDPIHTLEALFGTAGDGAGPGLGGPCARDATDDALPRCDTRQCRSG